MYRLLWVALVGTIVASAQQSNDARSLLQQTESLAGSVKNWRAEIAETSQLSGRGMNLETRVRIKIAVQAPLKVRRENSGSDQTVLVCDGTDSFYTGDGHSYYRSPAKTNPDCNLPLNSFFKLGKDPISALIVGHDHVVLADGPHACDVVRAEWKDGTRHIVRTMCIEPSSGLVLRDIKDSENAGMRLVTTTTFTSYESNPTFPPDTFTFSIPPGAVEAKPPI